MASFDTAYRLTLPPGQEFLITDGQGRGVPVTAEMEWVRPQSVRRLAMRIALDHPELAFTIEAAHAIGQARFDWHPMWWSPAAESKRHGLWIRLARAVAAFRSTPE